jgi:hypothetical protein
VLSPQGRYEQEEAYLEALHNAATYRVIDRGVEIADAGGKVMLVYARAE